jgi:hypothetical protein
MNGQQPIPHDGWRSRTYLTTVGLMAVLIALASVALFFGGLCTFEQWASFMDHPILIILGIGLGKGYLDKREQRKIIAPDLPKAEKT